MHELCIEPYPQETIIFFSHFWLQHIVMKSSKKTCLRCLITYVFGFGDIAGIMFYCPLKSVLKYKNLYNTKTKHFKKIVRLFFFNSCSLKELPRRFLKLELVQYTHKYYLGAYIKIYLKTNYLKRTPIVSRGFLKCSKL